MLVQMLINLHENGAHTVAHWQENKFKTLINPSIVSTVSTVVSTVCTTTVINILKWIFPFA